MMRSTDTARLRDVALFHAVAVLAVLIALTSRNPAGGGLLGLYMFAPLLGLLAMRLPRGGDWRRLVAGLGIARSWQAGPVRPG